MKSSLILYKNVGITGTAPTATDLYAAGFCLAASQTLN
jgi:hypothetical protein